MTGTQQFILGVASAVIAAVSGYLLHRRSKVSDAVSAQSGAASDHRAGVQQVIEGLNALLTHAQKTIADDRVTIKDDQATIKLLEERIIADNTTHTACMAENARLRDENARLRKLYGVNGDPPNKGT